MRTQCYILDNRGNEVLVYDDQACVEHPWKIRKGRKEDGQAYAYALSFEHAYYGAQRWLNGKDLDDIRFIYDLDKSVECRYV